MTKTRLDNITDKQKQLLETQQKNKDSEKQFLEDGLQIQEIPAGKRFFDYLFNVYYKFFYQQRQQQNITADNLYQAGVLYGSQQLLNKILIPFISKEKVDLLLTTGETNGE